MSVSGSEGSDGELTHHEPSRELHLESRTRGRAADDTLARTSSLDELVDPSTSTGIDLPLATTLDGLVRGGETSTAPPSSTSASPENEIYRIERTAIALRRSRWIRAHAAEAAHRVAREGKPEAIVQELKSWVLASAQPISSSDFKPYERPAKPEPRASAPKTRLGQLGDWLRWTWAGDSEKP